MMKKLTLYLTATCCLFSMPSCDVDSPMLKGVVEDYHFPIPDPSDAYPVDSDKVHLFNIISHADIDNDIPQASLFALYLGEVSQIAHDTVILYLHGNASSMNQFWEPVRHLANLGGTHNYGVMTYDYRGFGQSEGPSTGTESMRQDLYAAMQFLYDNGLSNDRLMVIGSSLGSLPSGQEAGDATGPLTINKLLLESPQSSANFLMQNASGLSLSSSMLTDFNFDLAASMALYDGELLWFHGTEDDVAPTNSALEVYKAHKGSYKEAYLIPGIGHGFRWGWGKAQWGEAIWSFMKH